VLPAVNDCVLLTLKPQISTELGRFHLSEATKALRKRRVIAILYFRPLHCKWWGVSVTPRPQLTPGKDPVPIVLEAGWASGPVWTGAEQLAPTASDLRTVQPVGSRYNDWATRPKEGDIKKIRRSRKEKLEKIRHEKGQGICGRKKYGKLGLKLCSYHNKVTEFPLQ